MKKLKGQKFGRLLVIEKTDNRSNGHIKWMCECECGNKLEVSSYHLQNGNVKSCGCLKKETVKKLATKHGKYNTRLYKILDGMKQRCYNTKNASYQYYGPKGIKVCDEWLEDFMNFYNWAIKNGYRENLTIDRIDSDKDYCPDNCRWVTCKEQMINRKSNHWTTYKESTKTLSQWAEEYNLTVSCLKWRLKNGWNIDKALNTPIKRKEKYK